MRGTFSHSALSLLVMILVTAVSSTAAVISVDDFGARGDDAVDDTEAFRSALQAAEMRGGALVMVGAGDYHLSSTIEVPSNTHLKGEATRSTVLHVQQGFGVPLLRLHDVENVTVSHLSLIETDHEYLASGNAIDITGQSQTILIDAVYAEGFRAGFSLGADDAQQATIRNVTLRNCHGESARLWSFGINHAQEVQLQNCLALRNRLDGIKLRKYARDVTIVGGESSHNGRTGPNGNGVDGYAGGDACVIRDLLVEHNNGSGIYIKTGPLHYDDFGHVRNGYLSGIRARYNRGSGIDLNRSGGDFIKSGEDKLPPLASHFTISGGVFEYNEHSGIYVRGRDVSLIAPVIRRNQQHGINLASAYDVEVIGALIAGNSLGSPGSAYGIAIGADPVKGVGHRIRIRGGTISGIDSDDITNASDYSNLDQELDPTHRNAIYIAAGADHILIDNVTMRHWTDGPHAIRSDMSDGGHLLVHYGFNGNPDAVGGPGSSLVYLDRMFIKTTSVIETRGWEPVQTVSAGGVEDLPANPVVGQTYFNTDRGVPLWFNGTSWIEANRAE
jgi:hypothetical protein